MEVKILCLILGSLFVFVSASKLAGNLVEPGRHCDPVLYDELIKPSSDALRQLYREVETEKQINAAVQFGLAARNMHRSLHARIEVPDHEVNKGAYKKKEGDNILATKACLGLVASFLTCDAAQQACVCKSEFPFNFTLENGECHGLPGSICAVEKSFVLPCTEGTICEKEGIKAMRFCGGVPAYKKAQQESLEESPILEEVIREPVTYQPDLTYEIPPRPDLSYEIPPRPEVTNEAPPRPQVSHEIPPRPEISFEIPPRPDVTYQSSPPSEVTQELPTQSDMTYQSTPLSEVTQEHDIRPARPDVSHEIPPRTDEDRKREEPVDVIQISQHNVNENLSKLETRLEELSQNLNSNMEKLNTAMYKIEQLEEVIRNITSRDTVATGAEKISHDLHRHRIILLGVPEYENESEGSLEKRIGSLISEDDLTVQGVMCGRIQRIGLAKSDGRPRAVKVNFCFE